MLKYMEFTAKTEDEAIAKGLAYLGLDRDDVSVEILERGKTGFLGIGSVPAKVKLTYEAPDEQPPIPQPEPAAPPPAPPPPQAGKAQALPPGAPRPQSGAQTPARPQGGQARAQGRA